MQPRSRKLLTDILRAADLIAEWTAGKSLASYETDALGRSAVERQLGIIGEAVSQLAKRDEDAARLLPEWTSMVGFRNLLIHGYSTVDDRVVWGIVEGKLPELRSMVHRLIET